MTDSTSNDPNNMSLKDWLLSSPSIISDHQSCPTIFLLDGGVSTHLRDLWGQDFHPVALWSSSLLLSDKGRATVQQGYCDWLEAGSNILTTVTYQCHTLHQEQTGMNEDVMNQALHDGVALARQAILLKCHQKSRQPQQQQKPRPQFVVGSMGCYGAALADGSEYTGNYPLIQTEHDLMEYHRLKTTTLLAQQPDGIALETVPCVMEVRAFLKLLKELLPATHNNNNNNNNNNSNVACWISLACQNGDQLNDGSPIEDALQAIQELDPDATLIQGIGINCCDSQHIASLARRIASFMGQHFTTVRAMAIYPNSGEEWDASTKTWKEGTGLRQDGLQDVFAVRLLEAVDAVQEIWKDFASSSSSSSGRKPIPRFLLGGCCRTRPQTIRALRQAVDQRQEKQQSATQLSPEQQRRMQQILARDTDLAGQIEDIGHSLQGLSEVQQAQGEAVGHQSSLLKKHQNPQL